MKPGGKESGQAAKGIGMEIAKSWGFFMRIKYAEKYVGMMKLVHK